MERAIILAHNTLKFARKLKQAGVPETQAEAQAEVLAEAFLHNLDEIVTRDYLDARMAEFDGKFRLMYWMMGLIAASTVPAALQQLFG